MTRSRKPSRDYAADMRAQINAVIDQPGTFNLPVVARELAEKLRATDPDLLHGWLDLQAEHRLYDAIREIGRIQRRIARVNSNRSKSILSPGSKKPTEPEKRSMFRNAAQKAKAGDATELQEFRNGWLSTRFTIGNQQWLLADMTGTQVITVANDYRDKAQPLLMQEAFLRAVAKKTGPDNLVRDKFTDDKLAELWCSLSA